MRKWLHCVDNSTCNQASPHCIRGSPGCHFHTHFTPSPMGVIISNHELICISVVVGGNKPKCSPGRTPLESFPQTLKTREGARRYINAFWAPFQGLPPLSHQDVYVLASLLPPGNPPSHRECGSSGRFPDQSRGEQPVGLCRLGSRRGGRPSGTATRLGQLLGPPCGKLAPAAGGSNRSGVLPLLLQSAR